MDLTLTSLAVSASDTVSIETPINQELKCLNKWLLANKLTLNVTKTEFMLITTRQKLTFIESNLNINIESQPIRQVKSVKTLGLHLQENLSWTKHTDHISKKVGPALGLLKRIRDLVNFDALLIISKALIQPHLDYGCVVWDGTDKSLAITLQKLQNGAARIITRFCYNVRSCDILADLGWETIEKRRYRLKKSMMTKIINRKAPGPLQAKKVKVFSCPA